MSNMNWLRDLRKGLTFGQAKALFFIVAFLATSSDLLSQTTDDPQATNPPLTQVQSDTSTSGFAGGITSNDFQPLMDLIQSVIKSDTWQDNGGEGSIIDYPAGVYANANAAVAAVSLREVTDIASLSKPVGTSRLRTISLNRLEAAVSASTSTGRPINENLKHLAGIYRVERIFIDTKHNDVLISGPAGPWRTDTSGRSVNIETGLPILLLDDLVVCLNNAFQRNGTFGCTIIPKPTALAAAQKFINATANATTGRRWRESLRTAVGKQDIIVHGVSPDSGVAKTIVEADCLMKRIGMGLEPSIDAVPDYFERVKDDPTSANGQTLIRWWFTIADDTLVKDADEHTFEIRGNTVKVLSENELLDQNGRRIHTGAADDATAGFAADFTLHFNRLSKKHPALAGLKNVFDLAILANIVKRHGGQNRDAWNGHYELASHEHATDVDSIMNFETINFRSQGKRYRRTIVGVSGGVEFDYRRVKTSDKVDTRSPAEILSRFEKAATTIGPAPRSTAHWWWDQKGE